MREHSEILEILRSYTNEELVGRLSYTSEDSKKKFIEDTKLLEDKNAITIEELDDLTKEELEDIFKILNSEEIRKIILNPKKVPLNLLVHLLSIADIGTLVDFSIKDSNDAISIFTIYFDIAKPLFEYVLIFDIFSNNQIHVLIDCCKDKEFIFGLINNKNIMEKLPDKTKKLIIEQYLSNYGSYNNDSIDKNIWRYVSGNTLAKLYEEHNPKKQEFLKIRSSNEPSTDSYVNSVRNINEEKLNDQYFLLISFIKGCKFSFNKLIVFLDGLSISDEEKLKVLKRFYQGIIDEEYDGKSFKEISEYEENKIKLLFTLDDYSKHFSELVYDLGELDFDSDFFDELIRKFLLEDELDKVNYRLFIDQLITLAETRYGIEVNHDLFFGRSLNSDKNVRSHGSEIGINDYTCGEYDDSTNTMEVNINQKNSICNNKQKDFLYRVYVILDSFQTVFHEMRHAKQHQKVKEESSMMALAFAMEFILQKEQPGYYKIKYNDLVIEKDARSFSYYEASKLAEDYLAMNGDASLVQEMLSSTKSKSFISDRIGSKIGTKEFNDRFEFLKMDFDLFISNKKVKKYRNEIPSLKLVTNEDGKFYTIEEIEDKISQETDPNIRAMYISYLNTLNKKVQNEKKETTSFDISEILKMISEYKSMRKSENAKKESVI